MERKKGVEAWAPVYLVDDSDGKTPETGITYSGVTVKYAKEGATSLSTKSMASGDWQELGDGWYRIKFSATELNTAGNFEYDVVASGCRHYPGHLEIVDTIEKDTYDIVNHATYGNYALKTALDAKAAPSDILQDPETDKIDGSKLDKAITALNDISAADVKAEVDQALVDYDPPTRAEATADKEAIIAEVDANETKIDTVDTVVDAIKARTDNLPTDPADDSDIDAQLATIDTVVDAIKTETDKIATGALGTVTTDSLADKLMNKDGSKTFDASTDSLEAIRDRGDSAWGGSGAATEVWSYETRTLTSFGTLVSDIWNAGTRTLTSFGTLIADIWAYSTRTLSSFGTLIADIWTYATRTLTAGGDATEAKQDEILTDLDEIKQKTGGAFDRDTDSLEAIRERGDEAWTGEGGGAGEGSVTVNHNTGGTDNLRYVTSAGAGIEDAYVRAYLKADYDAGNRSAAFVKAVVRTGPDGRWVRDMKLDPATYVFEFVKQGAYGPDVKEVTVTS